MDREDALQTYSQYANDDEFIVVDHVSFSYESDDADENGELDGKPLLIPVLNNVNIKVKKGEFLSLLGHNGSGKSSLAKLMNGMQLPSGGRVFVKGIDTFNEDLKYEVRQTVGLILQNPDNQIVSTIVEEDIAFGPENLGVEPKEIRRRVDEALKTVGMYEYRKHEPHRLSGGQKQRVAIAGILAMAPECIVLDESTAMLDPSGRKEVLDTIHKLNKEKGMTVIFITHNMEEAVLSDRIVVLDKGEIILEGTPKEVFSNGDKLREVELDVPQPTELCDSLRRAGADTPKGVLTVDDCVAVLARILPKV